MFCLSKCGVECIYVFRIGKSQERPNVADWPQGGTDRPSEGHPSSSSVSQAREDSRIWIESCVWSWFQQSRESPVHPLATSREESPLFRLSVISLVRNTNRKSLNSVYLSLFIRCCGCIQPLGLHNNWWQRLDVVIEKSRYSFFWDATLIPLRIFWFVGFHKF